MARLDWQIDHLEKALQRTKVYSIFDWDKLFKSRWEDFNKKIMQMNKGELETGLAFAYGWLESERRTKRLKEVVE
jgi:hypothetical protein